MLPLKIAILWHQHQPYYKKDEEFILPWVRLHGVKDYYDLAELLNEFPDIKQTFNIVPSMMLQVEDYISGKTIDKIQRLTYIPAQELNEENKREILRLFFLCNIENMVQPYPKYNELYIKSLDIELALSTFSIQDWRDLQIWYNLTWFGEISKKKPSIARMFKKGFGFTEEEKFVLMDLQKEILSLIKPTLTNLQKLGQVEISCSPMYHPILPLLCDSNSATEAVPEMRMPDIIFSNPEDALNQIENGINYCQDTFQQTPLGMWPSEGSISNQVLSLFAKAKIQWVASDEHVLASSVEIENNAFNKYFPIRYKSENGDIAILFRDHVLSDAIGFVYSRWQPFDAASDFIHKFLSIRRELVEHFGEVCLENAVVPVILDGENCWEFYKDNGFPFLREFYRQLSITKELTTVNCYEATSRENCNFIKPIKEIRAGSWINANFHIWMGHEEHRKAWTMLSLVRQEFEKQKNYLSLEKIKDAQEEIYIAEGSDWFWWYGDLHKAENKRDFDTLFRWHIEQIYKIIGVTVPDNILKPINDLINEDVITQPISKISPKINGTYYENEWTGAGVFDVAKSMSSMHQVGEILSKIFYGSDEKFSYFALDFTRKLIDNDKIKISFLSPVKLEILLTKNSFAFVTENKNDIDSFKVGFGELITLAIPVFSLTENNMQQSEKIKIVVFTSSNDGEVYYPRQGDTELDFAIKN